MQRIWIKLAALTCFTLVGSCQLQKQDKRSGRAGAVLDAGFVYIERTPNRTEAIVRFRTKVNAFCHLRFWSNENGSGGEAKAVNQKCPHKEARKDFSELIKPLKPSELYTVEISVWGRNGAFDYAEKFTVSEGENSLDKTDLFVARVNLPLRTTEIHRHKMNENPSDSILQNLEQKNFGCSAGGLKESTAYSRAEATFKAESVSTRGFTSGDSKGHDVNSSFRRLRFNSIATTNQWDWSFSALGKSYTFSLLPAPLITQVWVNSDPNTKVDIVDSQLTIAPREVVQWAKASSNGFKVNWVLENDKNAGAVVVQIGNNGSPDSINCIFNPSETSGEVPKDLIDKLKIKNHDLYVGVVSYQLDLTNQEDAKPAWLVEAVDWKLATVAVQQ